MRTRWFPWFLAAVFLGTTLTNWLILRGKDSGNQVQVENTTRDFLRALTNFGANTIDNDVQQIRSFAVGDFANEVQSTFSKARIQQVKTNKVQSVGKVQSVFVEKLEGETASVFAVVQETVDNNTIQSPRTDVLRIEVQLIDTHSGWKVNRVDILQSPGGIPSGG